MIVVLDLTLYLIVLSVLFHKEIVRRHITVLFLSLISSFCILSTDVVYIRGLVYYLFLVGFVYIIPKNRNKIMAVAQLYFVCTFIALLAFVEISDWFLFDFYSFHIFEVVLIILFKMLLFIVVFYFMYYSLYQSEQILTFLRVGNRYVFLFLIMVLFLFESNQSVFCFMCFPYYPFLLLILYIVMYVGMLFVSFVFFKQMNEKELLSLELEQSIIDCSHSHDLEEVQVVNKMKSFVLKNDFEGLRLFTKEYKDKMLLSKSKESLNKLSYGTLKELISSKIDLFSDVKFDLLIQNDMAEQLESNDPYFIEMFTIILDNACLGARKSLEKQVVMTFKENSIKISNSYSKEDYKNYLDKRSDKGSIHRVNGLKLLEMLNQMSDIVLLSTVDEMIRFEMKVIK